MTENHWTDRLSEYVDGELSEGIRLRLEEHIGICDECAAALEEIRAVVAAAAELPDTAPERDLWDGIASRLAPRAAGPEAQEAAGPAGDVIPIGGARAGNGRRRIAFTVPQLMAAGIAVVALSAGAVYAALELRGGPLESSQVAAAGEAVEAPLPASGPVARFTSTYEQAIEQLQAEFDARRGQLSPSTVDVVERNLEIIDRAIAEARAALAEEPSSGFLSSHLSSVMRRKVDLLRRAATIERVEI